MRQKTFDLTEQQLARLATEADRSGQGQAEIVRAALEMLFASRLTPYPTSQATSTATSQAVATSQDTSGLVLPPGPSSTSHQPGHQPGSGHPRARVEESSLSSSPLPSGIEEKRKTTTNTSPAAGFPEFWEAYPRKEGKKAAEKAWTSAKDRPPLSDLLASLAAQIHARGWPSQYTPHAATWLNGERWRDPTDPPPGNGKPRASPGRAAGADEERMRQYAETGIEWTGGSDT